MTKYIACNCAHCGTAIRARDKGRGQTQFFCSKDCQNAHWRQGQERPCDVCGTPTYRKPSHARPHIYCSRECADQDASANTKAAVLRGPSRANWKGGVI